MTANQSSAALDRLYREHKDHVFNYLARLTSDRELARDVTQQTFLKALTDPNAVSLDSPKAYLFTVARNTLYDEWKRKKERLLADGEEERVNAMPDDPLEAPASVAERQDMQDKVEQAISLLRPKFRELMLLRYTEDLSVEEIAGVTGRSVNDVKVNLHRARLSFDKDFTYLMYSRVAKARGHCDMIGELLSPYADKELPRDRIDVVAKHLGHCLVCARDMDEMKRDRKLFAAIPILAVPPGFDRWVPQSEAAEVKTAGTTTTKAVVSKALAVKLVVGVAVATLALIGGYLVLRQPTAITPSATSPTPRTDPATVPAVAPQADAAKPVPQSPETAAKIKGFYYDGAPFVAETVEYEKAGNSQRRSGTTIMSAKGSRGEFNDGDGQTLIWIANFERKKIWLVNPVSKLYVEDQPDNEGNPTGELKQMSAGAGTEGDVTIQGVGQAEPCIDYAIKRKLGEEVVLGRATEKWRCSSTTGSTGLIEWYDPKIKLTIRSEGDNMIQELHNIRFGEPPESLFELPAGYKKASFQQMFGMPVFPSVGER